MKEKNSFVLYTDYLEPLEDLTPEQLGFVFKAIMNYTAGLEIPKMDAEAKVAFKFIKKQLDRDNEKWEDIKTKRSEAGSKGGKQTQANASKNKQMQANAKQKQANQAVNVNVNENVNENVNVNEREVIYIPPTPEAIKQYFEEKHYKSNPEKFTAYYKTREWKIGNDYIRDWKAAADAWEIREKEFEKNRAAPKTKPGSFNDFPQRTYDYEALEKACLAN